MGFFDRVSNGWEIAKSSYKVLLANKQLILFPVLSGLSMLLIIGSFATALLGRYGWEADNIPNMGRGGVYLVLFLFYERLQKRANGETP